MLESNYINEINNSIQIDPVDVYRELESYPDLKGKYRKEIDQLIERITPEEF